MTTGNTSCHFLAGALGGSAGAIMTIPLEVLKTRLQSSVATLHLPQASPSLHLSGSCGQAGNSSPRYVPGSYGIFRCLRLIIANEGLTALFKGLGPTLLGVAPSRAIYFWAYATAKKNLNNVIKPDTSLVHLCSAACAGFTASSVTNPIWFIKTRLQLDQKRDHRLRVTECIRNTYKSHGLKGFYKGVTASYYGISETMIHFVIYEFIKRKIHERKRMLRPDEDCNEREMIDFVEYMFAGAFSKTCATCVAYPHEVARTRLRQEGSHYKSFWQTLILVFREDGLSRGLYRGLVVQLVRQIPNTAIMMATYEGFLYLCSRYTHSLYSPD